MVAHRKRQDDPIPTPTAFGISNAITATALEGGPTPASLAFDDSVSANQRQTAPPLAISTDPIVTIPTTTAPDTSSASPSSTGPAVASGASSSISISTVVGSCVGAFIGATALIALGLWFYRRYLGSLKKRAHTTRAHTRNRTADVERRRSHLEPWNKLDDTDDKWQSQYHTREVDNIGPMEKLTMFKKSPSVRTAWTHKSEESPVFDPQSFAPYHPSIAESIASKKGESVHDDEALLVMPRHNGAMSPSLQMAIPTPPAMRSQLQVHHWESAEVLQYDPNPPPGEKQQGHAQNPFEDEPVERRKSLSNPFFGAQDQGRSSIHDSSRSRSNSKSASSTITNKGKERAIIAENPFNDPQLPSNATTAVTKHASTDSNSSSSSETQERALQSLIAALNIPESEIQERLRVASMQPSVYSEMSVYTTTAEDEDLTVTESFPLPPSTPTTPQAR